MAGVSGWRPSPHHFHGTRDVAAAQASLVSFSQFLVLAFPVSPFLGLSELGGGCYPPPPPPPPRKGSLN